MNLFLSRSRKLSYASCESDNLILVLFLQSNVEMESNKADGALVVFFLCSFPFYGYLKRKVIEKKY